MHSRGYQRGQLPLIEPPATFQAKTMLIPSKDGIQIVAAIAPQINIMLSVSLEQIQEALQIIVKMRQSAQDGTLQNGRD